MALPLPAMHLDKISVGIERIEKAVPVDGSVAAIKEILLQSGSYG